MRNPNRCFPIACQIAELWQNNAPDWRFGQLMINFLASKGDFFYLEDDAFVKALKEYFEEIQA